MILTKQFPLTLAVCFAFSLLATNVSAQTITTTRPRQVSNPVQLTARTIVRGAPGLDNDVVAMPVVTDDEAEPEAPEMSPLTPSHLGRPEKMILSAIEERLGTPYRMGSTGPNRYDCSGFVWSVFQSAGINFERVNAHTLWNEFAPATTEEESKFGTLVFFNTRASTITGSSASPVSGAYRCRRPFRCSHTAADSSREGQTARNNLRQKADAALTGKRRPSSFN